MHLQAFVLALASFSTPSDPSELLVEPLPPPMFHCSSCGYGARSTFAHTLPAETLDPGRWTLGLRLDWNEMDPFSDAELQSFANQGLEAHSMDRIVTTRIGANYGVAESFNVGIDLPYISMQGIRMAEPPDVEDMGDSEGIGDLSVFGSWRFARSQDRTLAAALLVGLETPTGETHEEDDFGDRFEADHQPGSGSWDPFAGISVSKGIGAWSVGASALYTLAGDGDQDSNLGDHINFGVGLGWSAAGAPTEDPTHVSESTEWIWMLELFGEWHDRPEMGGVEEENMGGTAIFLAPGVRAKLPSGWSFYASIGLPVIENLYGEQAENEYWATTGLSYSF